MNPIRRELLNGLFVLVLGSLMSAFFGAFQITFNLQLWVLILIGFGVAVSGYVMFEITLRYMASTEQREKEWIKQIGTPARFEVNEEGFVAGTNALSEWLRTLNRGSDYCAMNYFGIENHEGLMLEELKAQRERNISLILEQQARGVIHEYKRVICFDHSVLANDPELKSGVLRVGEGSGTIDRVMGEHCRLMLETKNCSLFVAPAILQSSVMFYGADKVAITLDTAGRDTSGRTNVGVFLFCDPPNSEIIERFRQLERATERRMVAVHKIVFPEDAEPTAEAAAR